MRYRRRAGRSWLIEACKFVYISPFLARSRFHGIRTSGIMPYLSDTYSRKCFFKSIHIVIQLRSSKSCPSSVYFSILFYLFSFQFLTFCPVLHCAHFFNMQFSSFLAIVPLLAASCSAVPHSKRAIITEDVTFYAYGTNISGIALTYGTADGKKC